MAREAPDVKEHCGDVGFSAKATHHDVIKPSCATRGNPSQRHQPILDSKNRSLDNPSQRHQPVARILMLGTEVWTIRHDVINPSRRS